MGGRSCKWEPMVSVTVLKNNGPYPRLLVGCVEVVRGVEVGRGL